MIYWAGLPSKIWFDITGWAKAWVRPVGEPGGASVGPIGELATDVREYIAAVAERNGWDKAKAIDLCRTVVRLERVRSTEDME